MRTARERIRDAANRIGTNASQLSASLRAHERRGAPVVRGTSYAQLRRYLKEDGSDPSSRVLRALAPLLGVHDTWLITGEGPTTLDEALDPGRANKVHHRLRKEVTDELGRGFPFWELLGTNVWGLLSETIAVHERQLHRHLYRRDFLEKGIALGPTPDGEPHFPPAGRRAYLGVARSVGRALGAPLRQLGIRQVDPAALRHYAIQMCLALQELVPGKCAPVPSSIRGCSLRRIRRCRSRSRSFRTRQRTLGRRD